MSLVVSALVLLIEKGHLPFTENNAQVDMKVRSTHVICLLAYVFFPDEVTIIC